MNVSSVKENDKNINVVSLIIVLVLFFCFILSLIVVYFSYSNDLENYDEKQNEIVDEDSDEI